MQPAQDHAVRQPRLGWLALFAICTMIISVLATAGAARADTLPVPPGNPPGTLTPGATMVSTAPDGVSPDTGENCTTGASSGNVLTCMYLKTFDGAFDYAYGSGTVETAARTLDDCIYYGQTYLACTGWVATKVGKNNAVLWDPENTEPAGDYCAVTWRKNSSGPATDIGYDCVDFTS
jgi:hypothetical protein